MTNTAPPAWENMRTEETRMVERRLRERFDRADAYRYNSASIRVRVVDPAFEGRSREQRDEAVEEILDTLPVETQKDIVALFTFAPSELNRLPETLREFLLNAEFEDPSPSIL